MSGQVDPPGSTGASATAAAAVDAQPAEIAEMRAELTRLREELAGLRDAFDEGHLLHLREANENLVLAAMRADRIADIVVRLGRRAVARERRGNVPTSDQSLKLDVRDAKANLRDANEALMISALAAQEHEETADELHQRQVRYLAMVAHELRNPLSPIRTATGLLHRIGDNPAMLEQVQAIITRQVAHMSRLVEDLLDGARAATDSFRIEREQVDLGPILEQAVEACEPGIDKRRQVLHSELPDKPLMISGDAGRLAQVFGNLLDNASKYTPKGGEIRLTVTPRERAVCIRVADSGIGIAKDALERVFDLFTQEEHARASDNPGLGIGLAVVRTLVEAHGGQIVAHSEGPGCGSEFVVTLPIEDQHGVTGNAARGAPG